MVILKSRLRFIQCTLKVDVGPNKKGNGMCTLRVIEVCIRLFRSMTARGGLVFLAAFMIVFKVDYIDSRYPV